MSENRVRRLLLSAFVAAVPAYALAACEDTSTAPDAELFDSGMYDAAVPGPSDAAAGDSSSVVDDAGTPDADADPDSGATALNALYAHIGSTLVSVNPQTGALTQIGSTGQPWIVLAWDAVAKVARVIKDPYSPANGAAAPKLGTIDLCTGVVTDGPAITIGGSQVRRAEALAQDPASGTFYISIGTSGTGSATQYLTESNGTIDVATGAVTVHGSHATLQNDGDCATFIGTTLKLLDVASTSSNGALYTIDKANGTASAALTTGPTVLRVAYDPTRDLVFTAVGSGAEPSVSARSIGTLNLTTGASTPLGTALASGDYATNHIDGLLSAPAPVCP